MRRQPGRNAAIFILVTVFLDALGFGIIIPVLPGLIMELTGEGLSGAASFGGLLLFVYALMQFVFSPVMGNLSDAFGRRPVLLLSMATLGADYLIMGLAPTIWWLIAGRTLAGIAGSTFSTANAYIADVTGGTERARRFGLLGAAFGMGFTVGPAVGGLLGEWGPRLPFFVAAGLAVLNALYGLLVLPETLPKERRRAFVLRRANPVGGLLHMRRYPVVAGLIVVLVFYQLSHDANPAVWSFYTMLKFDWSELEVGLSIGAVGLLTAAVQGGLVQPVIRRLGEKRAVCLGLACGAFGFIAFALISAGWMVYLVLVPWSLFGLAMPAMRSIMSRAVPADAQGALQGTIAGLMGMTAIAAPLLMTWLFTVFTGAAPPVYFPGAPYVAAGLLVLVGLVRFALVMRPGAPAAARAVSLEP